MQKAPAYKLNFFKPNKTGLIEGSFGGVFFWGGDQFDPPSYFKKNLSNINITLCNCKTIYLKYVEKKNADIICYEPTPLVSL